MPVTTSSGEELQPLLSSSLIESFLLLLVGQIPGWSQGTIVERIGCVPSIWGRLLRFMCNFDFSLYVCLYVGIYVPRSKELSFCLGLLLCYLFWCPGSGGFM